jgi:hypothetical protein
MPEIGDGYVDYGDLGSIGNRLNALESMDRFRPALKRAIDRLHQETTLLQDLDQIGLTDYILAEDKPNYISTIRSHIRLVPMTGGKPIAEYDSVSRTITVRFYRGDWIDMQFLKYLAATGYFGEYVGEAGHEGVHALQIPTLNPFQKAIPLCSSYYLGRVLKHEELLESQAVRTFEREDTNSPEKAVERIYGSLGHKPGSERRDRRKIEYGVRTVDCLRALRISTSEIATVLREPGIWDEDMGIYDRVEAYLHAKQTAVGLSGNALTGRVHEFLGQQNRQRLQAMKIAQDVIKQSI